MNPFTLREIASRLQAVFSLKWLPKSLQNHIKSVTQRSRGADFRADSVFHGFEGCFRADSGRNNTKYLKTLQKCQSYVFVKNYTLKFHNLIAKALDEKQAKRPRVCGLRLSTL